jgi:tetrahydromethanopterin S-methyltransferase subunit A
MAMVETDTWPMASGDYVLGNEASPVAVLIVGRGAVEVPPELYRIKGILKTENIGLERVIANIISNPRIRVLVLCGKEEFGHFPGAAIHALMEHGVDEHRRIRNTRSAIPFLCDLPQEAVERFRQQVELVDVMDDTPAQEIPAYDPIYEFEEESRERLETKLRELAGRTYEPFPEEAMFIRSKAFAGEGGSVAKQLHLASDDFITPMLRLPSDGLNTNMGMILLDQEFGVVLEPLQGRIITVPPWNWLYDCVHI